MRRKKTIKMKITFYFANIAIFFYSDAGMKLFDAVNWDEVKETAKFYYTDETTTLNLYPALIISILLLFLLVPILGAIPTIDLFPSTSGGKRTILFDSQVNPNILR